MIEELAVFEEVINSKWSENTASANFLFTKWDVLKEKINGLPISDTFRDYTGGDNCQEALK